MSAVLRAILTAQPAIAPAACEMPRNPTALSQKSLKSRLLRMERMTLHWLARLGLFPKSCFLLLLNHVSFLSTCHAHCSLYSPGGLCKSLPSLGCSLSPSPFSGILFPFGIQLQCHMQNGLHSPLCPCKSLYRLILLVESNFNSFQRSTL